MRIKTICLLSILAVVTLTGTGCGKKTAGPVEVAPVPADTTPPPPDTTCYLTGCNGLEIECSTRRGFSICSEDPPLGDFCRQYAQCGIIDGKCQQLPAEKFDICINCISGCPESGTEEATVCENGCRERMAEIVRREKFTEISAEEARALIDNGDDLIILDVSPVYNGGHIPDASSTPLDSLDDVIGSLDKSLNYLVYSDQASSSMAAVYKLIDAGFTGIYRLDGEFAAWTGAGYEVRVEE